MTVAKYKGGEAMKAKKWSSILSVKKNRLRLDEHVSLCGLIKILCYTSFGTSLSVSSSGFGIGGSIVGGLIARLFSKPEPGATFHPAGFIMSIIGAIILLFIWIKLVA